MGDMEMGDRQTGDRQGDRRQKDRRYEDRRQGDRGWEIGRETEDRWMGDMKTEKQGDRRCVEGTQGGPTTSEMQKKLTEKKIHFNFQSEILQKHFFENDLEKNFLANGKHQKIH